jgi:hypothetical protein
VEPDGLLRQRCLVCGGPRVPVDDPAVARSGREIPSLQSARRERFRMLAWRFGAGAAAALAAFCVLGVAAVLLIAQPSVPIALIALSFALLPGLLAVHAWRRSAKHRATLEHDLGRAWSLVLAEVIDARASEPSAAELAALMRLDEARAEQLLAERSVEDLLRGPAADAARVRVPDPLTEIEDPGVLAAERREHE